MYFEIRKKLRCYVAPHNVRKPLGSVSMMTAAMHLCVLCMRYCNGIPAYVMLHYVLKLHLEMTKAKEMITFLYIFFDHPTYFNMQETKIWFNMPK